MNLLHLADLHLGKRVNGFDLLPDQRYILEQVLDLCTAHNVQAVALAGDIYDTALPPAAAVLLLDWFLTELAHRNIPVLAIAGNHDSAERLDYAAGLLSNQQVYLAGQFTSAPRRVILQDEFGELTFDLLPFVRPATVRHCLPDADIRDEDSAIAAALGPLNQLTAADTVTDAEDYIWATLTDPVPRPDAMAVLRAAYPNAMKLDYAPGGALDTGSDAIQTAALAQLRQEAGL